MIKIKADISAKLWCNSLAHAYKKIHSISQQRPHSYVVQFTLLLTNEPSLPYSRSLENPFFTISSTSPSDQLNLPRLPSWPTTTDSWIPYSRFHPPPSLHYMAPWGRVGCVRPVLINRPTSLMEVDVQFIVEQERNNPRQMELDLMDRTGGTCWVCT